MEIEIPHPHDKDWVRQELLKLPRDKRKATFENYKKAYLEYHAKDPHTARREANTRLRKYTKKAAQ